MLAPRRKKVLPMEKLMAVGLGLGLVTGVLVAGALDRMFGDVTVRVRDPQLEIYDARIWRWQTNDGIVKMTDNREYGPVLGWMTGPQWRAEDVLVLFGNYPEKLKNKGFDLVTTNSTDCGLPYGSEYVSFGHQPNRGMIWTNFGTGNWINTNLHGLFYLRFHGETNVLAEVVIR